MQEVNQGRPATILTVLIFSIAFCFIPASFVMFVIRERETNSKHQQLISGVSPASYWLSSFVWDAVAYFVTGELESKAWLRLNICTGLQRSWR